MKAWPWKCRAVDAEENRKQVSLRDHSPWKSPKARFPHFHRLDDGCPFKIKKPNRRKETPREPEINVPLQAHSWMRKCCCTNPVWGSDEPAFIRDMGTTAVWIA